MTGAELKSIRQDLGWNQADFGRGLGLKGTEQSLRTDISRYETGKRSIPFERAYKATQLKEHGIAARLVTMWAEY